MKHFAVLLAVLAVACTEVNQTIHPSPVSVDVVTPPATTTAELAPPPAPSAGTIELVPPVAAIVVGETLNVMVLVRDAAGREVPSEGILHAIADTAIVRFVELTDRTLAFEGVAPGTTSVVVTASGLSASIAIVVSPAP